MYSRGIQEIWKGRIDQGSTFDVWHQAVKAVNINQDIIGDVCILGFCSDVGVKRNLGRIGAVNGPDVIRRSMVNLAIHFEENFKICDGGNVVVSGDALDKGQLELSGYVRKLLEGPCFPVLLGGGHEISYGHIRGVLEQYQDQKIGVINFDPHFDLREYPQGPHSGSWARQLFDEYGDRFQYLPIGVNPAVSIASMFDLMREQKQSWISMEELLGEPQEELISRINYFVEQVDTIAITLDLDVFSAGVAPGVSAANPYGALPHHIKPLMKEILGSRKTISFDVAEMNPEYDDGRTAKLAAGFVYDVVMSRAIRSR